MDCRVKPGNDRGEGAKAPSERSPESEAKRGLRSYDAAALAPSERMNIAMP